jgi:threonine synthase
MKEWYDTTGYVLDPHTAVGVVSGLRALKKDPATPMIVLGTAHPAKFPAAVESAIGVRPELPPHLSDLMERREIFTRLPNEQADVEEFVRSIARAAQTASA